MRRTTRPVALALSSGMCAAALAGGLLLTGQAAAGPAPDLSSAVSTASLQAPPGPAVDPVETTDPPPATTDPPSDPPTSEPPSDPPTTTPPTTTSTAPTTRPPTTRPPTTTTAPRPTTTAPRPATTTAPGDAGGGGTGSSGATGSSASSAPSTTTTGTTAAQPAPAGPVQDPLAPAPSDGAVLVSPTPAATPGAEQGPALQTRAAESDSGRGGTLLPVLLVAVAALGYLALVFRDQVLGFLRREP